jgi:hypothetical protein
MKQRKCEHCGRSISDHHPSTKRFCDNKECKLDRARKTHARWRHNHPDLLREKNREWQREHRRRKAMANILSSMRLVHDDGKCRVYHPADGVELATVLRDYIKAFTSLRFAGHGTYRVCQVGMQCF